MDYANPGYHAIEIERNTRNVKERYRTQYHRIPLQNVPKIMISYLAFGVVIKWNCFPVKVGLSPYYTPQTIVDQQPLEYNKHWTIPFGSFIQANTDNNPTNSNVSRTIDRVYLISLDIVQGRHDIFDLHIHRLIKRQKITKIYNS